MHISLSREGGYSEEFGSGIPYAAFRNAPLYDFHSEKEMKTMHGITVLEWPDKNCTDRAFVRAPQNTTLQFI